MQSQPDLILSADCGGSYVDSLPPYSPKEEMVLLKLQRWVKYAANVCEQDFVHLTGVESVPARLELGLLV